MNEGTTPREARFRYLPPKGESQIHLGLTTGHAAQVKPQGDDGLPGTVLHERFVAVATAAGCRVLLAEAPPAAEAPAKTRRSAKAGGEGESA